MRSRSAGLAVDNDSERMTPNVLVDGRRGSEHLIKDLLALGLPCESAHLPSGDVAFIGRGPSAPLRIGIELKRMMSNDFINSMLSGRLLDQAQRMHKDYDRYYVIIEGIFRFGRPSGLLQVPGGTHKYSWRPAGFGRRPTFWQDMQKFITSLEECGMRVRQSRTSHETAVLIRDVLVSWWDKPYDKHAFKRATPYIAPTLLANDESEALQRFRKVVAAFGIRERSAVLLGRFTSIYDFITSDPKDWKGLAGIGQATIRGVQQAIHARIDTRTSGFSAGSAARRGSSPDVRPGEGKRRRTA